MQKILKDYFNAQEVSFSTLFSESVLARIHFMIRINPQDGTEYDFKDIEQKLIEVGRSWVDDLQHFLFESFGEELSNNLFARYKNAFPAVYTANFTPRMAVCDITHIEGLSELNIIGMNFYRPMDEFSENFRLKIYQYEVALDLYQ